MLRHSMFSNSYLNHRINRLDNKDNEIHGNLAVSVAQKLRNDMQVCRANSRTWWETGWRLQR